jgi:hypothetical protein
MQKRGPPAGTSSPVGKPVRVRRHLRVNPCGFWTWPIPGTEMMGPGMGWYLQVDPCSTLVGLHAVY